MPQTFTTTERILALEIKVTNAKTFNEDGRQQVVRACKELYELVEEEEIIPG